MSLLTVINLDCFFTGMCSEEFFKVLIISSSPGMHPEKLLELLKEPKL